MASEELEIVRLRTDFYRDGFGKLLLAILMVLTALVLLCLISAYLFLSKPEPVVFAVDNDWRVLPPVPVDVAYIKDPDLIQWVSQVLPQVLTYDFLNYKSELQDNQQYFSENGWKKFLDQLDIYANYNSMQTTKMFVNANAGGAPIVINRGVLEGRYAWWVQMPVKLSYSSPAGVSSKALVFQVLVVRIPTLNNLDGITIDNVIVKAGEGTKVNENGQ